jgi:hypothetical protein
MRLKAHFEDRQRQMRERRMELQTRALLRTVRSDATAWLTHDIEMMHLDEIWDAIEYLHRRNRDLDSFAAAIKHRELAEDAQWNFPKTFGSMEQANRVVDDADELMRGMERELEGHALLLKDGFESQALRSRIADLDSHIRRLDVELTRLRSERDRFVQGV